jgi:hypothetical protein
MVCVMVCDGVCSVCGDGVGSAWRVCGCEEWSMWVLCVMAVFMLQRQPVVIFSYLCDTCWIKFRE